MNTTEIEPTEQESLITKLTKDLRKAVKTLNPKEVRFMVDSYYQMQENRIRAAGQVRSMSEDGEPHAVLDWLGNISNDLEGQVKAALDAYSRHDFMGKWARSQKGIGPVLAAGLSAHIDISKVQTVGQIWRFAGQDPTCKWEKGQKRPWNASLKVLCWKIGESFVKVSGNDSAYYGKLYLERKELETRKNEAGEYKDQAEAVLKARPTHAQKAIYAAGKLPPGHIHARAKRWTVKLFLAHWFEVAYKKHYQKDPPLPYPIAHLGHAKFIPAPKQF